MVEWVIEHADLCIYLVVINIVLYAINFFLVYRVNSLFATTSRSLKICVLAGCIVTIFSSLVSTLMSMEQLLVQDSYNLSFLVIIIHNLLTVLTAFTMIYLYKALPLGFAFLLAACVGAALDMLDIVTETFGPYVYVIENYQSYWIKGGFRFMLEMIKLVFCSTFITMLARLGVFNALKTLMKRQKLCLLLGLAVQIVRHTMLRFVNTTEHGFLLYYFFIGLSVLIVVLLIRSSISDLLRKQLELSVRQQVDYTNRLEDIQSELRSIHHDYKNIAAGLYLQAEAGDVESVKEYVSEKLLQLDRNIQLNIRQMNQLSNIKHMELKSLLFTKTDAALKNGASFEIEVSHKIEKIAMDTQDLLRVTGILLDNAIEEAAATAEKKVICLLLQEDEKLIIMIKNSLERELNIRSIYQQGYSTKGPDRGLGLSSLRQITDRYKHVFIETTISQNWFVQIITIAAVR